MTDDQIKRVRNYCQQRSDIQLGYLFGSQARGDSRLASDIDLAFLFETSPSLDDHAALVIDLAHILETTNLDVVILNEAPPLLKYDVVSEGRLIVQNLSDDQLNHFELRSMKEFYDTQPLRQVQDRYLKAKVLGGPSGF